MNTRSKPPIVAFAHHPWDEPEWMNRQQLLSRLGKLGWSVAYSHGTLDWWLRGSPAWQASPLFNRIIDRDHIREIVPGRLGARWRRYSKFDRFQIERHARFVRAAVAKPGERIIALLFDPQFYPYIEHLEPCDVAFHAYDVYAHQSGWNEEKEKFQSDLLDNAKVITASSAAIARHLGREGIHIIPNGADVDAFINSSALPEPDDLKAIPHPRISYVGTINRKVDFPLIELIARANPNLQWVLVGRVEDNELISDDYNGESYIRCKSLSNVHFLGQKHRSEVPAYVGNMDINTMCYRADNAGWWTAGSPLKLYEYLSAGKPILSSALESVIGTSPTIHICTTTTEWKNSIDKIIQNPFTQYQEEAIKKIHNNSWDSRTKDLEKIIQEAIL